MREHRKRFTDANTRAVKKYPAIKPDKTLPNHQTSYRLLHGVYNDLLNEEQGYVGKAYSLLEEALVCLKKVHPSLNNEIVDMEISRLAVETNELATGIDKTKIAVTELLVAMRDSQLAIKEAYSASGQKSTPHFYTKDIPMVARYYMGIDDTDDESVG